MSTRSKKSSSSTDEEVKTLLPEHRDLAKLADTVNKINRYNRVHKSRKEFIRYIVNTYRANAIVTTADKKTYNGQELLYEDMPFMTDLKFTITNLMHIAENVYERLEKLMEEDPDTKIHSISTIRNDTNFHIKFAVPETIRNWELEHPDEWIEGKYNKKARKAQLLQNIRNLASVSKAANKATRETGLRAIPAGKNQVSETILDFLGRGPSKKTTSRRRKN